MVKFFYQKGGKGVDKNFFFEKPLKTAKSTSFFDIFFVSDFFKIPKFIKGEGGVSRYGESETRREGWYGRSTFEQESKSDQKGGSSPFYPPMPMYDSYRKIRTLRIHLYITLQYSRLIRRKFWHGHHGTLK